MSAAAGVVAASLPYHEVFDRGCTFSRRRIHTNPLIALCANQQRDFCGDSGNRTRSEVRAVLRSYRPFFSHVGEETC